MFNHIYLIILTILWVFSPLLGQNPNDCGESINCPKTKRPYGFCDGRGNLAYLCAEDPYNFTGIGYYSFFHEVLKLSPNALPLCLQFDNTGPDSVRGKICGGGVCSSGLWYLKSDFTADMNESVKIWKCACGWEEDDCGCTVKIGFVDVNDNQFKDPVNDFASNSIENQLEGFYFNEEDKDYFAHKLRSGGPVNNDCSISCDNLHIFLNNTVEFTQQKTDEPDYYEGNFFVSKTICDGWDYDYWGNKEPVGRNLRNVITQILGVLYGLTGTTYNGNCYSESGVMSNNYGALEYKELQSFDKCAFMTLYCPDLVPVEEYVIEKEQNCCINPNPSNNFSYMKINSDKNYENKILFLFDNLGRNFSKIKVPMIKKGENIIIINNEELKAGTYFYLINLDETNIYCKFVLIK